MGKLAKILSIINEKGGVGKTTTCVNLAHFLAEIKRKHVLIVDLDPQSNLTDKYFEDEREKPDSISKKRGEANALSLFDDELYSQPHQIDEFTSILGATVHISSVNNCTQDEIANFADNLNQLAESYDYILIDCPPSVGNLQFSAMAASWSVLIPTEAEADSLKGVDKVMTSVSKIRARLNPELEVLGIYLNKTQKAATAIQDAFTEEVRDKYSDLVFDTEVLRTTKVAEASALNQSIISYEPKKAEYIQLNAFLNEFIARAEG